MEATQEAPQQGVVAVSAVAPGGPAASRWKQRLRKAGIRLGVALVAYTLFGFFAVPAIIRHLIVPKLQDYVAGTLVLREAAFNPFTLRLRLGGFAATDADGGAIAGFETFEGRWRPLPSLWRWGWVIDKAACTSFAANVVVRPDGTLNLARFFEPFPDLRKLRRFPRIMCRRVELGGSSVAFADRYSPDPVEFVLRDLSVAIDGFDSSHAASNPLTLSAAGIDGAALSWSGSLRLDPLTSEGTLSVSGLDLARFGKYARRVGNGELAGGTLSAKVFYDFASARAHAVARVRLESGRIDKVLIRQPDGELLSASWVELRDVVADARAHTLVVGVARAAQPVLHVHRAADGTLTATGVLSRLLSGELTRPALPPEGRERDAAPGNQPDAGAGGTAQGPVGAEPESDLNYPIAKIAGDLAGLISGAQTSWALTVQRVQVEDATVHLRDDGARLPVELSLRRARLDAGPIASAERYATAFKASAQVGESGAAAVEGRVAPFEPTIELTAKLEGVAVAALGAYLPEQLPEPLGKCTLARATAGAEGRLAASLRDGRMIMLRWQGRAGLNDAAIEGVGSAAHVRWRSAGAEGDAEVTGDVQGVLTARWSGKAAVAGFESSLALAGPVDAGAESVEINGKAVATLDTTRLAGSIAPAGSEAAPGRALDVSFTGDVAFAGGAARLPERFQSSASAERGDIRGISLELQKKSLAVETITIDGAKADAVLPLLPPARDGADAGAGTGNKEGTTEPKGIGGLPRIDIATLANGWNASVKSLRLRNATVNATDPSATPPLKVQLEDLNLQAEQVSTDPERPVTLKLESHLANSGQLRVSGTAAPFAAAPSADVMVRIESLPVKPFDAVTGRYVGYLVERGRVSASLPAKLVGENVTGEVEFGLDQFHLGESVDSPEALDLPVKLGLDLLRDRSDQINGKIAFAGKTTDPDFSIGSLVWTAIGNLIGNAVTAPFQLLGALFGAGEEDISFVAFAPGSADLDGKALSKLDVVTRAMNERPAINVAVEGKFSPELDGNAIAAELLKKSALERLRLRMARPDVPQISDEQYRMVVEELYDEAFPRPSGAPKEAESVPWEKKEAALRERITVPRDLLADLARRRAEAVVRQLIREGQLPRERVGVSAEHVSGPGPDSRADLKIGS